MDALSIIETGALTPQPFIIEELFNRWTSYLDAKPRTIDAYTRNVKSFMLYLSQRGITQPQRTDIIAYRDTLKLNLKPATVQAYLQAVKLFFQWTAQEGLYPNVSERIKGATIDAGYKKDCLTTNQISKLLSGVSRSDLKGKRDYAMLTLMITGGLRTIEVARANVEDLRTVSDFTALYLQGKGHEEKTDYVKVAREVEDAIRDYLKTRGKAAAKEPLFSSTSNRNGGGRMTTRSISRIAKERLLGAGLDSDRLTAHSLRHTAATLNLLNGATVEETMQLLRHGSINTTLIYAHALERANNNSEERIAKAIFG